MKSKCNIQEQLLSTLVSNGTKRLCTSYKIDPRMELFINGWPQCLIDQKMADTNCYFHHRLASTILTTDYPYILTPECSPA